MENIQRLKKKTDQGWTDSTTLKITFSSHELPQDIYIGRSYYKVRPYVAKPVQCYHCQRLGHTSSSCKGRMRCMVCGENHNRNECPNREPCCANCGGPHTAISNQCQQIQQAHQIERLKATEGKTHKQARDQVLQPFQITEDSSESAVRTAPVQQSRQHQNMAPTSGLTHHQIVAEVHNTMSQNGQHSTPFIQSTPYSTTLKQQPRNKVKQFRTCGTQTEAPPVASAAGAAMQQLLIRSDQIR